MIHHIWKLWHRTVKNMSMYVIYSTDWNLLIINDFCKWKIFFWTCFTSVSFLWMVILWNKHLLNRKRKICFIFWNLCSRNDLISLSLFSLLGMTHRAKSFKWREASYEKHYEIAKEKHFEIVKRWNNILKFPFFLLLIPGKVAFTTSGLCKSIVKRSCIR